MQKRTHITDHPRNREKLIVAINKEIQNLDCRALMKLYALAHRMRRDKVK